jgi:hypothetical protein
MVGHTAILSNVGVEGRLNIVDVAFRYITIPPSTTRTCPVM